MAQLYPDSRRCLPELVADAVPSLTSALTQTASGSCLISAARLTSSHPLPVTVLEHPPPLLSPDWSLLHVPIGNGNREDLQRQAESLQTSLKRAKVELEVHREILPIFETR